MITLKEDGIKIFMGKLFHLFSLQLLVWLHACSGIVKREQDCNITKGMVLHITEGGINDAVFHLVGNDTVFYINRAFENGYVLAQLRKDVVNKNVTIYYVPSSSFFKNIPSQNIYRIDVGENTLYSGF